MAYGQQSRSVGSNYRYSQPTTQQYESFFNPIPLDFMTGQLDKAQGQYDNAYAGALAAKDQYGGIDVGLPDVADKNRIVGDFVDKTDQMVKDQYQGDWGKASKAIAKSVSDIRQDPFWNTSKRVDQLREEERNLVAKYGPNALQFKSVANTSVIDPATGKVRTPDQFKSDIVEKGDWNKTIQTVLGKITPDSNPYGLTKADFGYIQSGQINEVTQAKLDKLASDPNVQQSIISAHPEMARAFSELKGQRGSLFGEGYQDGQLKDAVKGMILGNIKGQEFRQNEKKFMQDWELEQQRTLAGKKVPEVNPYINSTSQLAMIGTDTGIVKEHERRMKGVTFKDGNVVTGQTELNPEKQAERDKITSQYMKPQFIDPESGRNLTLETALRDFDATVKSTDKIDNTQKYYTELTTKYPELKGMNQEQAFKAYDTYIKAIEKESRTVSNIVLENSSDNVKNSLVSNINAGDFESYSFRSTGDVVDRNSLVDKLGYKSYAELKDVLDKEKNVSPRIDFRQAKMLLAIPSKKGDPVDVYFNPDLETKELLNIGQALNETFYNSSTITEDQAKPIPIPGSGGLAFVVEGEGNIVKGNKKRIHLVDMNVNEDTPEDIRKLSIPEEMSLQDANAALTKIIDNRFNNIKGKK
jgi:hypothetical protein